MNSIMEVSAIIPTGLTTIVVLKFVSGDNPIDLILKSEIPVTFGEPVPEEEPEFNRG